MARSTSAAVGAAWSDFTRNTGLNWWPDEDLNALTLQAHLVISYWKRAIIAQLSRFGYGIGRISPIEPGAIKTGRHAAAMARRPEQVVHTCHRDRGHLREL